MDFFNVVNNRFSNRKYLDKQISDDDLNKILNVGMQAPIGRGKYDDMHITVIQNKDLLNEISNLSENSAFYSAPTLIIISARDDGHGLCFENSACVAENMLLGATALGLGSIYLNLVIGLIKNSDVLDKLNLTDGFVPIVCVGVGYIDGNTNIKKHKINVDYM